MERLEKRPTLDPVEQRVLGSLIEKGLTTPEYYPLTLNALRTACNQKSNRDPVVEYDDVQVAEALTRLRHKGLVESVYTDGGRAERIRHLFSDAFALTASQTAVLSELLLRGPQTAGELNSRASRMSRFGSATEVAKVLESLAEGRVPVLVEHLERRPGQKDRRWRHLFGNEAEAARGDTGARLDGAGRAAGGAGPSVGIPTSTPGAAPAEAGRGAAAADPAGTDRARAVLMKKTDDERIKQLESDVAALKRDIAGLSERFEGLRYHLDEILKKLDK